MPDVGIVMPVYKQKPSYLRAAIQSILKQSYSNFKFIIVIDGAPEVRSIIQQETQHDKRVTIIMNERNQGVAKTLNCGFEHLYADTGIQYLTWVSSDNIYYPDYIRLQRRHLRNGPEQLGLIYTCFREIDDNDRPVYDDFHTEEMKVYQKKPKEELLDFCLIGPSFMYKSMYAKAIDGYGTEPVEDYEYWLRLTELCDIEYIPQVLMDYRVNSAFSVSAQLQSNQQHRRWRNAYQMAKLSARQRRNIPLETTVLHPVTDGSSKSIDFIEHLLEQYYSNFRFIVLDLTPGRLIKKPLSDIPDPKIQYKTMPGMSEREAILQTLRTVQTPFTMVYGKEKLSMFDLQRLAIQLRKSSVPFLSAYFTLGGDAIECRIKPKPVPLEPVFNELYKTIVLKKVLGLKSY
ncbi:glycosyltransferase family 2 protein [Paenibacillus solisilvae]|uniref:Glycosyltransferase family 2 protein n=1 Tax=Paenibacillus solisilvae TaxID=2486751 RepID=A0ABW0W6K2_9BACL